tara:strand:+ start:19885 stop:20043 length:159 start_codon:yes stop_codon:yes gene_type:complete
MEELINIIFLSSLIVGVYLVFFTFAVVYIHSTFKLDDKLDEEEINKLFESLR